MFWLRNEKFKFSLHTLKLKSCVMYVFVYCRRALLGLNMRKVFHSIEVAEIGENKLACERDQAVDTREQDFDLVQVWNLKYEEVLKILWI